MPSPACQRIGECNEPPRDEKRRKSKWDLEKEPNDERRIKRRREGETAVVQQPFEVLLDDEYAGRKQSECPRSTGSGSTANDAADQPERDERQGQREERGRIEVRVARLVEQMAALSLVWDNDAVRKPVGCSPTADEQSDQKRPYEPGFRHPFAIVASMKLELHK